jgi:hypothetical protein
MQKKTKGKVTINKNLCLEDAMLGLKGYCVFVLRLRLETITYLEWSGIETYHI